MRQQLPRLLLLKSRCHDHVTHSNSTDSCIFLDLGVLTQSGSVALIRAEKLSPLLVVFGETRYFLSHSKQSACSPNSFVEIERCRRAKLSWHLSAIMFSNFLRSGLCVASLAKLMCQLFEEQTICGIALKDCAQEALREVLQSRAWLPWSE